MAIAAVAAMLSCSTNACKCPPPQPLSACDVRDYAAAMLVTIESYNLSACGDGSGVRIANAVIDKIFKDNSGFGLRVGDRTSISSNEDASVCGLGSAFLPDDQWIMFAVGPHGPREVIPSVCDLPDGLFQTNSCSKNNVKQPTATQIEELTQGCAS